MLRIYHAESSVQRRYKEEGIPESLLEIVADSEINAQGLAYFEVTRAERVECD